MAYNSPALVLTSRAKERAQKACDRIARQISGQTEPGGDAASRLEAAELDSPEDVLGVIREANIVIACGAAGVELVSESDLRAADSLAVAIDLNAVPPAGLGGVSVMDKAQRQFRTRCGGRGFRQHFREARR